MRRTSAHCSATSAAAYSRQQSRVRVWYAFLVEYWGEPSFKSSFSKCHAESKGSCWQIHDDGEDRGEYKMTYT